jgi:drug/metabolite transporter (DMT)-like permease
MIVVSRSRATTAGRSSLFGAAPGVLLLPFVLVSFAANSLVTRYVVSDGMIDPFLLSAVRFVSGALALLLLTWSRRVRPSVRRSNVIAAVWLGTYAVCISYGYRYIGAAAGTFVFYATVLVTLVAYDKVTATPVPVRRGLGAVVSLLGIGVLAAPTLGSVTLTGVVLLAVTGAAWGLYTASGRAAGDPSVASTGNFTVLAALLVLPTAVAAAGGAKVTAAGFGWAVVMGVFTTALAYVAWYACQHRMSATTAGSVQLVIPILTTIAAVLLLGERLSASFVVAAVLVAAGMWVARPARDHR